MNLHKFEIQPLNQQKNEYALVLFLDEQLTEFANELGTKPRSQQSVRTIASKILKEKYPTLKVTVIKVVMGGVLVTSLPLVANAQSANAQSPTTTTQTSESSNIHYRVVSGDTLWSISRTFNTTVDHIKRANHLTSDTLHVNQRLVIPRTFHTVVSGETLSGLARNYQTTSVAIREANQLTNDTIRVGQSLLIPIIMNVAQPTFSPTNNSENTTSKIQIIDTVYTVIAGDSLSVIAKRYGTTTEAIRSANGLVSDVLQIGQRLVIPNANTTLTPSTQTQTNLSSPGTSYSVVSGDTLWSLAQRFQTTVEAIRKANQLTSDTLHIGQRLSIPGTSINGPAPTSTLTHMVVSGESLWSIASKYITTVDAIRLANHLRSDTLQIGQTLTIPSTTPTSSVVQPTPSPTQVKEERTTFMYTVRSGDNLSVIAQRFGVTVDAIRTANSLRTDTLQIGQVLTIPNGINASTQIGSNSVTHITHTVVSGDTIWDLSVRYGIPQTELMRVNHLTSTSRLTIGQKLTVPVHQIAVKPVVSARHGELLDWWTEAQYVFPIGKVATVIDFETGQRFQIKRTIGANHADSETLTVADSNIARSIWGGFSWTPRAVIIEVDGRRLAASMSFMPHDVQFITNNGITGHFDVYFSNSTRHVDGRADSAHQLQIERAAGLR
ncbi:LysM peptidoglycan-binding domain-containing protein [Bacillus alkalicellulosilyticus]|uniref:LysM peptidoglycan-binding domain-containing protein n=1 Tax=Alkalihalobacterium alkalicellulosilyticum TaxID=1912214 RepID=UPI000996CFEC|nr:LysM peptidoglycan-binding domain-containing protein [Bacillus alkalicellulosilyticus]